MRQNSLKNILKSDKGKIMDNGFKRWLINKLDEIDLISEKKLEKRKRTEEIIRNQIIPEIINFLNDIREIMEKRGYNISLESGPDWFEFKMHLENGDYEGLGIQFDIKDKKFKLLSLRKTEGKEYISEIKNEITENNWLFSEFKEKVQHSINTFLMKHALIV